MNNSVMNTARLLGAGLRALLVLTLVTGVIYPLAVTGVGQALFHNKANGSEIESEGKVVGSSHRPTGLQPRLLPAPAA